MRRAIGRRYDNHNHSLYHLDSNTADNSTSLNAFVTVDASNNYERVFYDVDKIF